MGAKIKVINPLILGNNNLHTDDRPAVFLRFIVESLGKRAVHFSRDLPINCRQQPRRLRAEHATFNLIGFDRLEECLEISFTKALVALAFDELEKNGANHCL